MVVIRGGSNSRRWDRVVGIMRGDESVPSFSYICPGCDHQWCEFLRGALRCYSLVSSPLPHPHCTSRTHVPVCLPMLPTSSACVSIVCLVSVPVCFISLPSSFVLHTFDRRLGLFFPSLQLVTCLVSRLCPLHCVHIHSSSEFV